MMFAGKKVLVLGLLGAGAYFLWQQQLAQQAQVTPIPNPTALPVVPPGQPNAWSC